MKVLCLEVTASRAPPKNEAAYCSILRSKAANIISMTEPSKLAKKAFSRLDTLP